MDLELSRTTLSPKSTIGTLSINGQFHCYTLEDVVRPVKQAGITAIPAGKYQIVISYSDRFRKPLPLLLNVPDFTGIRIHPGNWAEDTEGCILVGETFGQDVIKNSVRAFNKLFSLLSAVAHSEKIYITIH